MAALVIIHPEMADPELQGILENVIQKRIVAGKAVYVLPAALTLDVTWHPFTYSRHENVVTIESYLQTEPYYHVIMYQGREYTGTGSFAPQFLALKKKIIEDKLDVLELAGVARAVCVAEVFRLLCNAERTTSFYNVNYQNAAVYLGMENDLFQDLYKKIVPCHILDDLCDRI